MKGLSYRLLGAIINLYLIFYATLFVTDYSFIFRKGLSNVSSFTVPLLFLLLIWRRVKGDMRGIFVLERLRQVYALSDRTILFIFFLAVFATLSLLGIVRHMSFSTMAWDMGIFDQAIWNTLQGNLFFSSIRGNINLLGDHFEPILFFLLPFYRVWPHVFTLVIVQAVILALSVYPLYMIAREKLNSRFVVFSLVFSFVLSKGLRGVGLSDFHPDAFIVVLSLLAFHSLISGRFFLLFISVLLLLACKETAALIVLALGLYALFSPKRRMAGLVLSLLAIIAWVAETRVIIPMFNVHKTFSYYLRMPFGATYKDNFSYVLQHPVLFLKFILLPGKLEYCFKLLGSLGFLPLFAPGQYVLVILPLSIMLLASESLAGYYLLSSHYVSHVLPFVYISSIYGIANLIGFLKKGSSPGKFSLRKAHAVIGSYIIFVSLLFYGKTDAYKFRKFVSGIKDNRVQERLSYLSLIPKDASVSASSNLIPQMSQRKYIYDFNPQGRRAFMSDYIIIDYSFLGYLPQEAIGRIPEFIKEAEGRGYKKTFVNNDGTFLILFNPRIDRGLLDNYAEDEGL